MSDELIQRIQRDLDVLKDRSRTLQQMIMGMAGGTAALLTILWVVFSSHQREPYHLGMLLYVEEVEDAIELKIERRDSLTNQLIQDLTRARQQINELNKSLQRIEEKL